MGAEIKNPSVLSRCGVACSWRLLRDRYQKCLWIPTLENSAESAETLVSAAGFEPATHALKGEHFEGLSRGFNQLRAANPLSIGAQASQSALNLHLSLHPKIASNRRLFASFDSSFRRGRASLIRCSLPFYFQPDESREVLRWLLGHGQRF